ncbi:MAG: hypothetical protein K1X89_05330, partial [Myxococcaceae bacterium]|nr:hypothetical protein [Myxococcaceae bacterium]
GGGSAGGGSAGGGSADAGPAPVLTALGPSSTARDAGPSGFYVNLAGSSFTSPMSWSVNGKSRGGAVFVDAGLVRGFVDRSITSTAGTYAFSVQNQGGLSSSAVTFTVTGSNPVPVGNAITPSSLGQGSGATGATISGSDLISGTTITASNGQTTYPLTPPDPSGNPSQTTVLLPEAMLATPGLWTITLVTPAPGGGTSTVDGGFTVVAGNPTPAVRSWTPYLLVSDGGAQDLTISGTGFYQGSAVVDQTSLATFPTVSATSTSLVVTVPADHVALDGFRTLRVVNAAPGGGQSNLFQVSVKVKPTLSQVSPSTATANSGAVLTLTGTGFVPNFSFVQLRCPAPGCSMLADGGYLPTRTIYLAVSSDTQGTLDLTPTQIPTAGTYGVAVSIEGGHTSNELPLTVQ